MEVTQKPRLHQDWIDSHAFGIVKALQRQGHQTYLVGGCVRDLLLGILPKDFDIATTAHPEAVSKIIYKAYVIGKRFRLVLVKRDNQQFEVATFRREIREDEISEELPPGDNLFGTAEEDARRRDFTINGLFYDPVADDLIDYIDGLPDLNQRVLRMIGDPNVRLLEDPIRILRAIRLSHKIGFSLDSDLRAAIQTHAASVAISVLPRRREEILKLLRLRDPSLPFIEAHDLGVLKFLSPTLDSIFTNPETSGEFMQALSHFHDKVLDRENPIELFGALMLIVFRLLVESDPLKSVRTKDVLENPRLFNLMKDELGLFKHEQSLFSRALQIQSLLLKRSEFERKGERRRNTLLTNEAFPLALQLAERDYLLSPNDYHFWLHLSWNKPPTRDAKSDHRGRRRRRRRPPRPNTVAAGS